MSNVVLSAYKNGFTVRVDGKTVESKYLSQGTGTVRESTMRSLNTGLKTAKTYCDHDLMVIEVSDLFIFKNISNDRTTPKASVEEIYALQRLIQDCNAEVNFIMVSKTHAERYVKVAKPEKVSDVKTVTLSDAFTDIED